MNARDFAKSVIEGSGGMNDFENREMVVFEDSDRVEGALWMLRCLANTACEGSQDAIEAILTRRMHGPMLLDARLDR